MGVLADRATGYGGLLAGAVASEIPYGYGLLLESLGVVPKGYANQVQGNFMPTPNQTVQSDLQAAAPYIQQAGDLWNAGATNVEDWTGMPREMVKAIPEMGLELAGSGLLAKGVVKTADELPGLLAKGADNLAQPNYMHPQAGMTAWHGSPHKHSGLLDPDKIGTGEGAQAYGYGHYLAENPDVAGQYRDALSTVETTVNGIPLKKDDPLFSAVMSIGARGYDNALKDAKDALSYDFVDKAFSKKAYDDIVKLKGADIQQQTRGSLYEYDLPDSTIEQFLDWDAPLSESPAVQKLWKQISDEPLDRMKSENGAGFYDALVDHFGSKEGASDALQRAGIPGIKYYDGGSRAAGEGTRNFVIFPGNEDLVKPLSRNGEPLGLLGPGKKQAGAVGLLDMDEASRMQRAKDMGFDTDTTLYHGTGDLDPEFDVDFDPEKGLSSFKLSDHDEVPVDAVTTSIYPEAASGYAEMSRLTGKPKEGGHVYPLYARGKEVDYSELVDELEKLGISEYIYEPDYAFPGYAGLSKSLIDKHGTKIAKQNPEFLKYLEDRDIGILNLDFGLEGERLVVNPNRLRSTFAKFDPAKKNSKNIMDSWYPYAAGLGLLGAQQERERGALY